MFCKAQCLLKTHQISVGGGGNPPNNVDIYTYMD